MGLRKKLLILLLFTNTLFSAPHYYGGELCAYEDFKCINIKPGDTWEKLFPNSRVREIIKRLNRMNTALNTRRWIVIPTDLHNLDYISLSPFPIHIDAIGNKSVLIKLSEHAFGAYDEAGNLIHWGPVSGGQGWCRDIKRVCKTALGEFKVIEKEGPDCVSNQFPADTEGGAPMPYCMFYYRGFALHGSTLPGFHASHGCIRLFEEDAKWLNEAFVNVGTDIMVSN